VVCDLLQLGVKKGGGEYIAKDNAHLKMRLWAKRGSNYVLQQINKSPKREES